MPTMSLFNPNDLSNIVSSPEDHFSLSNTHHDSPSTPRNFNIASTDMYATSQTQHPVFQMTSPTSSHYNMQYNVHSSPQMQLSSAPMQYGLSVGSNTSFNAMDNASLGMSRSTSGHSTHSIQGPMFMQNRHAVNSVNSLINFDSNASFSPMATSMPLSMPTSSYTLNAPSQYTVGPMGHGLPPLANIQSSAVYELPAMPSSLQQDCTSPTNSQTNERTLVDVDEKKQIYSCTYSTCTLRFTTTEELQIHKKEAHRNGNQRPEVNQKGPFYCRRINPATKTPCDTSFNRPYDLTRHEHSTHGKGEKFACDICPDRLFSRADALTRHYAHVHHQTARPKDLAKRARRVLSRESLKNSRSRRSSLQQAASPVATTQQDQQHQTMSYPAGGMVNLRPLPMSSVMNANQTLPTPYGQYTTY